MRRRKWWIGLLFAAVLAFGSTVHAVPSLGVGTGTFDCTGATEYWQCFNGNLGKDNGFALPTSGGTVTPFTNIINVDIWLLAEPNIGGFTFTDIKTGKVYDSGQVSASGSFSTYQTPYWGVDLGMVDTSNGGWVAISSNLFNPGSFYMLPGTISYSGTNVAGDWLFLIADDNGIPGLQGKGKDGKGGPNDSFSPPSASAVGVSSQVPEPGTLLLLGAGLLGLPLFGRKFKKA